MQETIGEFFFFVVVLNVSIEHRSRWSSADGDEAGDAGDWRPVAGDRWRW